MLRLGIVSPAEVQRSAGRLGTRRHVSALILAQLFEAPGRGGAAAYDGVVEQLRMPNGTWKFTCRGRFAALDRVLLDLVSDRVPRGTRLTVMDLAASTGVTSVELHRVLRERYALDFLASDLYRDLYAVRRGPWTGVFTADGEDVQHVLWRFVLPGQLAESWAFAGNRALRSACRRWGSPGARAALARAPLAGLAPFETTRVGDFEIRRLPLLSGDCLALVAQADDFRFEVRDLCRPLPDRAMVVRAMNILTREHFDDATRARIVRHLIDATLPGGLLVVGWSPWDDPTRLEASVYEVGGAGLERVASVGPRAEMDRFLESVVPVRVRAAADIAV